MSFSVRYLPAVLFIVVSLAASAWAQSTAKQTKAPRASISGRITIKDKGAAGVVVGMRKAENFMPFEPYQRATTDQDGFYRLSNIAPGNYEIAPSAPAYVPADSQTNVKSKTVLISEDENVDNINFALVRGGVITGRVTDADGRPVIQQEVSVYSTAAFDRPSPQQVPNRSGAVQTDDRGIYRIYGLAPGRYKVATGRSEDPYSNLYNPGRAVYKQVFHPDVSEHAKATIIEVGEGTEATNVDITVGRALQTFSVSGRVVDAEKGTPVPNMRFGLQRSVGQRTEFVNNVTSSNTLGDFIMEGLLPGKYMIYMFPNTSGGMRAESLSFDIIDQDVSGVTVRLMKGASVSGVVVIESEDKTVIKTLTQLQVRAFVQTTGGGYGSSSSSPISPDGSFNLTGLAAGTVNFALGSAMMNPFPPKGFNVARVEREGVAGPHGFEIKEGEQVTGVRLIVSFGSATIRGVVKIENGSLPDEMRIFIRLTKQGETSSNMRPPQVDARGRFLIEGVAAGTYEISAVLVGKGTPPPPVKREITVQDGVATDITLTIDMNSGPKP